MYIGNLSLIPPEILRKIINGMLAICGKIVEQTENDDKFQKIHNDALRCLGMFKMIKDEYSANNELGKQVSMEKWKLWQTNKKDLIKQKIPMLHVSILGTSPPADGKKTPNTSAPLQSKNKAGASKMLKNKQSKNKSSPPVQSTNKSSASKSLKKKQSKNKSSTPPVESKNKSSTSKGIQKEGAQDEEESDNYECEMATTTYIYEGEKKTRNFGELRELLKKYEIGESKINKKSCLAIC